MVINELDFMLVFMTLDPYPYDDANAQIEQLERLERLLMDMLDFWEPTRKPN